MIHVKITMNNGETYKLSNQWCDSIKEWIIRQLMPNGVEKKFHGLLPGIMIKPENICSIVEISKEELIKTVDVDNVEKQDVVEDLEEQIVEAFSEEIKEKNSQPISLRDFALGKGDDEVIFSTKTE